MDFSWSAEQSAFKERVVDFARKELDSPSLLERERTGDFAADEWRKCAEFGIQSLAIPSEFNTTGVDTPFMTAVLAMEALGYGCRENSLTFSLNAHMWTVAHPIAKYGTDDQKRRYLPDMCRGTRIGAHALTEAESGSDGFSLKTRAEKRGDGYILNGKKQYVSLGAIADLFLVFATIDPALGKWGVTAFLVDSKTPGVTVGQRKEKLGLRTVPMADISFEDCLVGEDNRLGKEGAGVAISNSCLEVERACILASQLGAMERQLEESIRYVKERHQFGQAVGKFQSVSNRVADMKLRLETARLLLYKVAWMKEQDQPAMLEAALLKLHLSESFVESSMDAVRNHGGKGYLTEFGVERDLRDAVGGVLYAGTTDIQRWIVAKLLGL